MIWVVVGPARNFSATAPLASFLILLVPAGMLTFLIWAVYETIHRGEPVTHRRGVLKWAFIALLMSGIGYVLVLSSKPQSRNPMSESATIAPDIAPIASPGATDMNPWIRFTFTAVELRDIAGARWLAIDYVDDVHGNCQKAFPWEATIPGFTATTRTSEFVKDDKGSPPVRHQRIEYRLPDSAPREQLERLRENLENALKQKSVRLELGENEVPVLLFELPGAEGGSFKAWVKVVPPLKVPTGSTSAMPGADRAGASAELWSPNLAPGEKPSLSDILQEARSLAQEGRHEEALQRHLWYHNHALEFEPGQAGVRLSFALSYWVELARRYPKAKEALVEIRDRGEQEFAGRGGYVELFSEISAINGYLGQKDATLTLFKSIQSRNFQLARQCYRSAEELLVEAGDYALCARFVADFQKRFESIRAARDRTMEIVNRTQGVDRTSLSKHAQQTFIKDARRLVEILVGTGRKADAENIRDQAVALLDVPELQSAVTDAEQKVASRSAPAR
jgi:hypothetical protein